MIDSREAEIVCQRLFISGHAPPCVTREEKTKHDSLESYRKRFLESAKDLDCFNSADPAGIQTDSMRRYRSNGLDRASRTQNTIRAELSKEYVP